MNLMTYFVTLNWNTTAWLVAMIESVERATPEPHTWIIIENGSGEENQVALYNWAHDFFDDFAIVTTAAFENRLWNWREDFEGIDALIIRSPENLGCVLGHNLAFDAAAAGTDAPHEIVMVDTDVLVFESGWLTEVHGWADEHPEVGIIGMEHGPNVNCAPAVFLDTNGNWYLHEKQMARPEPVEGESVGLGFALIRWPVLQAGVRFDTGYKMYYKQDDDFCFQVRADLGLDVWAYPVENVHFGSASLQANNYQCGDADGWDEFDQVKQANQAYFTKKWRWLLEGRRRNMEEQARHLTAMKLRAAHKRGGG